MPTELDFIWEEKGTSIRCQSLSFRISILKGADPNCLYCGMFNIPLEVNGILSTCVQFTDFLFIDSIFTFYTPKQVTVVLPQDLSYLQLKIITPVPYPLPESCYDLVSNSRGDECYIHAFHYAQEPHPTEYKFLEFIKCSWSELKIHILTLLADTGKGLFGPTVGIMIAPDICPDLEPIENFFQSETAFKKAKKTMIMIVSSFTEFTLNFKGRNVQISKLPSIPKDLISRQLNSFLTISTESLGAKMNKLSRRLFKTLLCGGVPLNLFEKDPELLILNPDHGQYFESSNFDRVTWNLDRLSLANVPTAALSFSISGLKKFLKVNSNEATLRSMFWDSLLRDLFLVGYVDSEAIPNYNIQSEWQTQKLFPRFGSRRVDFVVTITPNQIEIPILFVEIGTERFDVNSSHKDFTKLTNLMSLTCIFLARNLLSNGKTPENAFVYGIWIGGLTVQLIVAHPIVRRIGEIVTDIHSNLTFEDEWVLDFAAEEEAPVESEAELQDWNESVSLGDIPIVDYPFTSFNPITPQQGRIIVSAMEPRPSRVSRASVCPVDDHCPILNNAEINFEAIKKLYNFIEIVKCRIRIIMTEISNGTGILTDYEDDDGISFGYLDSAREGVEQETPKKNRLAFASATKRISGSGSLRSSITVREITKTSISELEILRKLTMFPETFARMYSSEITFGNKDSVEIRYQFEWMFPFFDRAGRCLCHIFPLIVPEETLEQCIKFSVDCLYGLYLLHELFGIIHSDISINNLMFSIESDCWKLIDFNQSESESKSLQTRRTAGTKGFISPESLETGIFSKKSDIFSLGTVISDYLNPILMNQFFYPDYSDSDSDFETELAKEEHVIIYKEFSAIFLTMISTNPETRPSALHLLHKMFSLYKKFNINLINPRIIAISNTVQVLKNEGILSAQELKNMQMFKRSKRFEEKEPFQSQLENIIQTK